MQGKAFLGIALVFLLGCLAGGFGTGAFLLHREALFIKGGPLAMTDAMERKLNRELNLDPDQRQQIHQILTDASEQMKNARREIQPQIHAIQAQARQRIAALLRPDQLESFHRVLLALKKHPNPGGFNSDGAANPHVSSSPYFPPAQPVLPATNSPGTLSAPVGN